ncbi:MAG: lamin tail domain-containing protein [Candidatus Aureabacteria bacterium]|nr:lamin tail domain-containing protein [Candidatus Auribacterota bacterium]
MKKVLALLTLVALLGVFQGNLIADDTLCHHPCSFGCCDYNQWINPADGRYEDGKVAVGGLWPNNVQGYYDFDLQVPPNAVVRGIQLQIRAATSNHHDQEVPWEFYLSWDGCTNYVVKRVNLDMASSLENPDRWWFQLGGPNDLWGHNWVPGDFDNGKFRLVMNVDSRDPQGGDQFTYLDLAEIRVYYAPCAEWWCENTWRPACSNNYSASFTVTNNYWLTADIESYFSNRDGWTGVDHNMNMYIYGPDNKLMTHQVKTISGVEHASWPYKFHPTITGWYTAKFICSPYAWHADGAGPCECDWEYYDEFGKTVKRYYKVGDTDKDMLPDYDEIYIYGTNPNDTDTDDDWLPDGQEVLWYKTNPKKWDTDNDSYCDGHEVSLGRDPKNPQSHPGQTSLLVINEILYDAVGDDTGNEFIELRNNQSTAIDLSGYQIQASDIDGFKKILTIPRGKKIQPNSYFLIAGHHVTPVQYNSFPDIRVDITMQNANGHTSGVRLVRYDGYVLDTVLYGGPPNYNLFGDDSRPDQTIELCPRYAAGHSLSRKTTGLNSDTNRKEDWQELTSPSPTTSRWPDTDNDGLCNVDELDYTTYVLDPDTDKDGWVDGAETYAGTNPTDKLSMPQVKINEIYYDPSGADDLKKQEYIELYNNENHPVPIGWCGIQYGGPLFGWKAVGLPIDAVIPQHGYYVIGDENVQSAFGVTPNLVTGLELQNGDQNDPEVPYCGNQSPTDGVRFVGYAGMKLDTVLYDAPNTNKLEGDARKPAGPNELCTDVLPGHSLSRRTEGADTNNKNDWLETVPSPGMPSPFVTAWCYPTAAGKVINDWQNETNAFTENGICAIGPDEGQDYYLFNIPLPSLPAAPVICGIEIGVKAKGDGANTGMVAINLSWDSSLEPGHITEPDKSHSFPPQNLIWKYYGGAADTWGRTWQASDFSNANFLLVSAGGMIDVDVMKIRVYYK